ncbi:MAG TPA: hypothetical protein VIY51_00525 [Xanthobacteraceae bacterium]
MTQTDDDALRFVVTMAIRNALKPVRKHIGKIDERIVVTKLLRELETAGYEIVRKPGSAGFAVEPPTGRVT